MSNLNPDIEVSYAYEVVIRRFVHEIINHGNYAALDELVQTNYVYRNPEMELTGPEWR